EQDGVITLPAVDDDPATYEPVSTPSSSAGGGSQIVKVIGETDVELLDIPIVRDMDDDAGFYAAFVPERADTWSGARLYRSIDDGGSYSPLLDASNASAVGSASGVLGDFHGGNIVDELNRVDIVMTNGELASITRGALLNGGNLFLLGDELLQAQRCELV